jgi:hypothetical protein
MDDLQAGANLSTAMTRALETLTALKMGIRERGAAAASDPVLDDLVETEIAAAQAWLARAPRDGDRSALWTEANKINVRFTHLAG